MCTKIPELDTPVTDIFRKSIILQISRFNISRHWQFYFSCKKLGQVTISGNILFSHSILLYGKASEVKRQENFFLQEMNFFFFFFNQQKTPDTKRKSTLSRRLQESANKKQFDGRLHNRQKQQRCTERLHSWKLIWK